MNNKKVARELIKMAKELTAFGKWKLDSFSLNISGGAIWWFEFELSHGEFSQPDDIYGGAKSFAEKASKQILVALIKEGIIGSYGRLEMSGNRDRIKGKGKDIAATITVYCNPDKYDENTGKLVEDFVEKKFKGSVY